MSKKIRFGESTTPADFEWPEFSTESKRIKVYSERYRDLNISEAFEQHYNLKFKDVSEMVNYIPSEIKVGNTIKTKILSIDKDLVVFDSANFKTNIQSGINLYKYDKFKHFFPMDDIEAVVTKIDRDKVIVDPISPMVHKWLNPILTDPTSQKIVPGYSKELATVTVKNLQLTRGGFIGKAVVPVVSEFVGEDYTIDAFIPGSQIVLNITDDFESFVGTSIETFVVNYIPKPGSQNGMSLVCSAKDFIKFKGELNMIELFKHWCEETEQWKQFEKTELSGKVTGVINSSKKCGVFVEIPELEITGFVEEKPEELVNYKPHNMVKVKLVGFDEETYFDHTMQQMQHVVPYEIENGVLRKCNLKPILQFV